MNIHQVLFFCFLSVLNDRNTGIHGEMMIPKTEGEDFRHSIKVGRPESTIIYLCRNNCTKEDILIEALGNRATTGKYIIRYDEKLFVTIKQLTLSDAGWYRFGVANSSSQGSYMDFEIRIKERCKVILGEPGVYSIPEGGNITIRCPLTAAELNSKFLCRKQCQQVIIETNNVKARQDRYSIEYGNSTFFNVSITQLTKSDSGQYRCGVGRQMTENTCWDFEITVTNGSVIPLAVSLNAVVLLAVFLLFLYKWKIIPKCLKSRGTSTGRSEQHDGTGQQHALYDNNYPAFVVEEAPYETVDPPASYQILNQSHAVYDHIYSAITTPT
ncbi:CXADR-like membrane protein [Channa argus]|uniref:CXADR-like membrane protein n=1 Tax=Channa argus TaxID=215402 RepID=UPI0029447A72|nr:hypothetical protein Q8A73_013525 [Channa argus]